MAVAQTSTGRSMPVEVVSWPSSPSVLFPQATTALPPDPLTMARLFEPPSAAIWVTPVRYWPKEQNTPIAQTATGTSELLNAPSPRFPLVLPVPQSHTSPLFSRARSVTAPAEIALTPLSRRLAEWHGDAGFGLLTTGVAYQEQPAFALVVLLKQV